MKHIFLSNSDHAGGIAYNVKKIYLELNKKNIKCSTLYLNNYKKSDIKKIVFEKDVLVLYCTSTMTLLISCMIFLIRASLLKKTIISQIIYHPRFIDPRVSHFRKILNFSIRNIPQRNIFYYSDECVYSSKIISYDLVDKNNIIGLCSIYNDIKAKEFSIHGVLNNYREKNKKIISTIGRLVDFKIGYIIELIRLAKMRNDFILVIIGFGPEEKKIIELISNSESIFFIGKRSIAESKYLVENSDLYVGMGTTLVDANSLSIPAIVAIESNNQGLTSGFFSSGSSMCFGEYSCTSQYYKLADFLSNILDDNEDIPKATKNKSHPWNKIENNIPYLENISFLKVLIIITSIFTSYIFRFFSKNDYH
ncbi:glycosyltransferase [Providencia alcalifaciens]|uniref:glycosyltransferase n=1 Tax=Providencia TaxID=586 RepID=UPI0015EB3149|nr:MULTISPECIES: glycosyltransferase [Providencia]QLQ97468.1 glycosyltransferase [Providencia alcalifaciens]